MDLKKILKDGIKLPVAENHFIKPPQLPYITFIQDKEIRGITDNLIIDNDITVELYTSTPDEKLEKQVMDIIINNILNYCYNDQEIEISQNREYITSEQMYMTSFDFNLIEKGGN